LVETRPPRYSNLSALPLIARSIYLPMLVKIARSGDQLALTPR
jgi:hypothetical protein